MKRVLISFALLGLMISSAFAQNVPELPFESVPNPLKLPADIHFGEIAGVAVNSHGHVFIFSRGGSAHGPAYMATAAQLLEFDAEGNYVREIGKNLNAWSYAHAVRVDPDDNIWVVDKGSNMILRFTPEGHVDRVFGRKAEASHIQVPPDWETQMARKFERMGVAIEIPEGMNPRNPVPVHRDNVFNQPTDVAWDSEGSSYFSDGYINSRVAKVNARGEWIASWGSLGSGPGQFDTPHGIAVSPADEIYVADRGNRRIQVFDKDGNYIREFTVDVPVDTSRGKITYGSENPNGLTGSQSPGAPDALCMTPGPNPVLFIGDLYPSRVYKVSLQGEVLGVYGQPGRNLGEFGWIHGIACPSEDEIWVAELINWRVQKLVTKQ